MVEDARDEEELIRRYREGDGEALEALFLRHRGILVRRIERWLPRHVRRRVSVSDVLQESRIAAFERRLDFEPRGEGAFRNWVLGIVEKKARKATERNVDVKKRAAEREVTRAHRPDTAQFLGQGPSPSEVAVGRELQALAERAMSELPDDYREVLRLSREERLPLTEVALQIGRSHEATKKLYGRALARFGKGLRKLRGETDGG
jgi:RNA polymerase sigma-70 factor (ECF subfamily)